MSGKATIRILVVVNRLNLFLPAIAVVLCAVLFLACPMAISHAAIVGTGDVNPLDPTTWTSSTTGYIGKSSTGTVNVDGGNGLSCKNGYLGNYSGSTGSATITGVNSTWTIGNTLYVGVSGNATLNIAAGGKVSDLSGYIGSNYSPTASVTVTGTGSTWISGYDYVCRGTLRIEAGGQVTDTQATLGTLANYMATATVTGAGSTWTNNNSLSVGSTGNGTLNVEAGGQVNCKSVNIATYGNGTGAATVTGAGSTWTINDLEIGENGTLTVSNGGSVSVNGALYASLNRLLGDGVITAKGAVLDTDLVFDASHGLEKNISFGTGGSLNINYNGDGILGAGATGNGTLRIADGVAVTSDGGCLGNIYGSTGTATITGAGSTWIINNNFSVGKGGKGILNIEAGGQVISADGTVGSFSSSTATVTGIGSSWISHGTINVYGKLNITTGGQVSDVDGCLDNGMATVSGADSTWTNSGTLFVGNMGYGTLNILAGGKVIDSSSYMGYQFSSHGTSGGTVTVTGTDAMWINTTGLAIANGTLNVGSSSGSGGLVTVKSLTLQGVTLPNFIGNAVCAINGGTLQAGNISKNGNGYLSWTDGTIQNYDANTDLSIASNLGTISLGSGMHNFNIDAGRKGTVDATLASNGTLTKQGGGLLILTAANTYGGETAVEAGRFKVTGSILNTSGVTVEAAGTLELAKVGGSATAANLAISNDGLVLVSAGSQTAGTITGGGITQVNTGANLTAGSIVQGSLIIGASGAGAAVMSQVRDPSMGALLAAGVAGLVFVAGRRKVRAG